MLETVDLNGPNRESYGLLNKCTYIVIKRYSFNKTIEFLRSNQPIKCKCNKKTILMKISKKGKNKGKQFHTCSEAACDFFQFIN
jgi:hypothetical protein